MAYEANKLEEEKEEGVLQGTEGEGVKQISQTGDYLQAGGGAQDVTQTGTGQAAAPAGGQDVSTQQKYMEANKQKALELAGKTAGVISGDITGAQESLTGAGEKYKSAVGAGTTKLDQELYKRATESLVDQQAYQTGAAEDFLSGVYQPATKAQEYEDWYGANYPQTGEVPVQEQDYQKLYDEYVAGFTPQEELSYADAFKKQYSAEYGGPTDIYSQDYYAQALRDTEKAKRTAGLIGDITGRQELLTRTYENPSGRFSKGALALDEALLTGNEEAYAQLQAAADAGLGLEGQIKGLGEMSQQEYEQALETTKATKEAMRKQFDLTKEEQEIRDYTSEVSAKAKSDYESYLDYINKTYGTQEGILASGSKYFTNPQDYQNIQAANVASADDYARMRALEELTGGIGTLTPFSEQAGKYKDYIDPAADFNKEAFQVDVAKAKKAREDAAAAEAARLAAVAAEEAARKAEEEAKKKQSQGVIIGAVAGGVVGGPAGAVVGGAIGYVVTCFDGDSEFKMMDGKYKKIKDIQLGDILFEGGLVYTVSKHILEDVLYSYPTDEENSYIWVTGKHAVKEDGVWKRIENSRKASVVYDHNVTEVYSLSCENHVMISHGVVLADYDEVPNSQSLDLNQCLTVLNHGELKSVC